MKSTIDDSSLSLDGAAADLGVTVQRVLEWMENNEWLILGDTSYDVVHGQLETGNLSARAGGVRVTQQGMQTLRREIKPRGRKSLVEASVDDFSSDVPF